MSPYLLAYSCLPKKPHNWLEKGGYNLNISEAVTVAQVLEILNIPEEQASIILINGRHGYRESVLNEGDVLAVFPLIAGGSFMSGGMITILVNELSQSVP